MKRLDSHTIRLALSYLAIIMVLSLSFSVIFYHTSTGGLRVTSAHIIGMGVAGNKNSALALTTLSSSELNAQLQKSVQAIDANLAHRLVLLNISALAVGSVLSYYLARRTLRPVEAAMEAQSRFTSDASHELRTPLTVMQSENEGALRTLELSDRARAVLQSNLEEIAQLKGLSESLLRLARDNEELTTEPVWIDEVIAETEHNARKFARTRAITIDTKVPHARALADAPSLVQVISILLDNAIKYSLPQSTVFIEGHVDGRYAFIKVRDLGSGISSDDLPYVFDRFYRSKSARKQYVTGHGLGLSIAKKLVEQQHGTLDVTSELGKGSTFTVKLPAFQAA